MPAAVAGAIAGELESLSLDPRARCWTAAAVAGEPFEPDLAAAIGELGEADGLTALDDLLDLDLVRPTQVPRRFIFRHPLVRQAVYESTRGGWRLAAHARAADALAAPRRRAPPSARTTSSSRRRQGDQEAIEILLEAGRAAAPRAPGAAARWFEAALRLLPSDDTDAPGGVRVALASAQRSLGELDRCRATLLEALGAAARRVRRPPSRADDPVRGGRALAGPPRRRASPAGARLGGGAATASTAAAAALQIELAVDGIYELDFDQARRRWARGALETARRSVTAR